jgi:hypothetical protein
MPDLLHEYWANEDGDAQFGPVREDSDRMRPILTPNAKLVFSLHASSWHQAMQLQYDRLGYGDYYADGVEDYFYTDEEAAVQAACLSTRDIG